MSLVALLKERKMTVATVESCTGGMIAAAITAEPGASSVFSMGLVTYTNEVKEKLAGVPADILERHGAVSPQTALAMTAGGKKVSGADLVLAVTGYAGPDGEDVGLVYIAANATVRECRFTGGREEIRLQARDVALALGEEVILNGLWDR